MRQINQEGLEIIKSFETLQLKSYDDGRRVWTIGWGHTGPEVEEGQEITPEDADALLLKDLEWAEKAVSDLVLTQLTDNEFSALVIFIFNVGRNAFRNSTLLQILNTTGNKENAAEEFDRWVKMGGQFSKGLARRRDAEKKLFLKK